MFDNNFSTLQPCTLCQTSCLEMTKIGTGFEHGGINWQSFTRIPFFNAHSIIGFLMDWIEYIIMRIEGYEPKCKVIYNTHICRNWCKRIRKWIEITFVQIKMKYHFNLFGIYIAAIINFGPRLTLFCSYECFIFVKKYNWYACSSSFMSHHCHLKLLNVSGAERNN